MATAHQQKVSESDAIAPQSPPPSQFGYGEAAGMSGFIWQQLSEIQKTLGSIQEAQKSLGSAQDKADEKVSGKLKKIEEDLAEIKQIRHTAKWLLIVGGAVGSIVLTVMGYVVTEVWSIAKPVFLEKLQNSVATQPVPLVSPTVVAPKK